MSAAETFRAFPSSAIDDVHGGMSLRDWFASQALGDVLMAIAVNRLPPMSDEALARMAANRAYIFADAMMAERAKGGAA